MQMFVLKTLIPQWMNRSWQVIHIADVTEVETPGLLMEAPKNICDTVLPPAPSKKIKMEFYQASKSNYNLHETLGEGGTHIKLYCRNAIIKI